MLIVSYFCIATEIRFIIADGNSTFKVKEGELWHRKAIDIAKQCLPSDCPLISHLEQSFTRNYSEKSNRRKPISGPKTVKKTAITTKKADLSFNSKSRESAKTPTPSLTNPRTRVKSVKPNNSVKLARPRSAVPKRKPVRSAQEEVVLYNINKDSIKDDEILVSHQDYSFGNTQYNISVKPSPIKKEQAAQEISTDRPRKIGICLEKVVNKDLSYDSHEVQLSNIDSTRIIDKKTRIPALFDLAPPSITDKLELYAKKAGDNSRLYESFNARDSEESSHEYSREEGERLFTEPNDRERIVISSNDLYGIYSSETETEEERSVDYSQISNEDKVNFSTDSRERSRFSAIFQRIQGRIAPELNQSSTGGNT
jgi:hypothetical protein